MNFWPQLDPAVQHGFQFLYGVLLWLVLAHQLLPHWRRFFLSERWGGYTQSTPSADLAQRPASAALILLIWMCCATALILDWRAPIAALVNVMISRYYFVAMRWNGVQRGFGAPGFMTYWLGVAALLLAFTRHYAPSLHPLAVLYLQVDVALIIFSAALYKIRSGYLRGEGMDYGLVNPMWGYWPEFFRKLPVSHPVFRFLNHSAWTSQLASAGLMLVPATRWLGGLAEVVTYIFIASQIRLGWLAEQMTLTGLLFFTVGSPAAQWWTAHWPAPSHFLSPVVTISATWVLVAKGFLWIQLTLTPLCHAALFLNYYGGRRFPAPWQRTLETYSNFFGIIVWRVFSVDHLNFFVKIYHSAPTRGERTLISEWRNPRNARFWHVGEAITVTSLFTTLKYYPNDDAIFRSRILRYARTLPCPDGHELIFSYHTIRKENGRYGDRIVAEYHVDPRAGTLRLSAIDDSFSAAAAHDTSPLRASARPGSYVPAE